MSRYFIQPRAAPDGHWNDPLLPSLSVNDHTPYDTGLVDQNGDRIMRAPRPVGFHHPKEKP